MMPSIQDDDGDDDGWHISIQDDERLKMMVVGIHLSQFLPSSPTPEHCSNANASGNSAINYECEYHYYCYLRESERGRASS
mmetsp:Transcript_1035/g.1607  ORF Transcript_1035/g.1607 Transcript_1035/m.1607 type:complete len:81 (+) Transcript_1035:1614-1856(+)